MLMVEDGYVSDERVCRRSVIAQAIFEGKVGLHRKMVPNVSAAHVARVTRSDFSLA